MLATQLFGPIKQWGFLVKDLDQAMAYWKDVLSPYSEFYNTDKQQFLHQVAYFTPDIDTAIATAKQAGMTEQGFCKTMLDQRYVYMGHPMMGDVVVELMEVDDGFVADYERCAQQAETWDGSDPYRLISL
jgi:hypothetical protein